MSHNKKGFTLIELLAVIVILAVILAVAVPSILGLIDNVKRNAFKSSVSMALEQGRLYQLNNTIGSGKTLTEMGLTAGSLNSGGRIKEENNILLTDLPAINNGNFCVIPGTTKNDLSNGDMAKLKIQACKTNPSQGEVACNLCDVDITAPTNVSLTIGTVTSKSIEVIASGTDAESDIISYAFSKDNGSTWSNGQASNVFVFNDLNSGTYHIKVRIYNSVNMFTDSSAISQATALVNTPTYSIVPTSGWATSKTVTIDFQATNYTKEYSIDGGDTWTTSATQTKDIVFNAPGNVIARITDGTNTIIATTYNVTQIDTTAPTLATVTIGTVASNSIEVIASGTDDESGIVNYAFSKDNGTTWTMQASNTYVFTGLASATYQIIIRVYNAVDMSLESSKVDQQTITVNSPTYSIVPVSGWATSKIVTIDYQTTGYTKEYSIDGGSTWTTSTTQTKALVFNAAGNVIARITDGTNTITATTYNVSQIDVTAPTITTAIGTVTETSIQVIGSGTDDETGIANYAFSKDNGSTWTAPQAGTTYTFTGLTAGTIYQIKVKATNTLGSSSNSTVYNQATTYVFAYTGAVQNWSMPMTGTAKIEIWGAQGQDATGPSYINSGGKGGYASGSIGLTSGTALNIYVGGQSGWNGGGSKGSSTNDAGNGGGASDVRIGGTAIANRVIVAGAGGGAGNAGPGGDGGNGTCGANYCGGAGGGAWAGQPYPTLAGSGENGGNAGGNGGTGPNTTYVHIGGGGGGGGYTGGGLGGFGSYGGATLPTAGTLGMGGNGGGAGDTYGGGAGGSGYYGGGGGGRYHGAGGGGSSYVSTSDTYTLLNPQFQGGFKTGNGLIKITITTGFMVTISAVTDNSIQVVGIATDTGGGSYTYSFSKDNGATWSTAQNGSTYTFSGLTSGTIYQIKVRATNTSGTIDSRLFTQATTYIFAYTGAVQNWSVPITGNAKVEVWGAQGQDATGPSYINSGGKGGKTTGTINLTSGTALSIYVGGQLGWNGGGLKGSSTNDAGNGGGSSDIRIGGIALTSRVIVAGAGGGAGNAGSGGDGGSGACGANYCGGAGGSAWAGQPYPTLAGSGENGGNAGGNGGTGPNTTYVHIGGGGGGGGYTGGGLGGFGSYGGATLPTTGALGIGGNGGVAGDIYGGGAGGAGYYGGGGGGRYHAAGGGGSSFISNSGTYIFSNIQFQGGIQTGNGLIRITIQ